MDPLSDLLRVVRLEGAYFFLEDHAVRHSYHHLARIQAALGRKAAAA
jgi:hypothetical protein